MHNTTTAIRVAEATRAHYLRHHSPTSATTIAFLVLFDALIEDLKNGHAEPVTFLTRDDLKVAMKKHGEWNERDIERKPGDIADFVKKQLLKYRNKKVTADGQAWLVTILGPIPVDRQQTPDREELALEIVFHAVSRDHGAEPKWPLLIGRCVCCDQPGPFHPNRRYCNRPECPGRHSIQRAGDTELLVTIIPERKADYGALRDCNENAFVRFVGDPVEAEVAPSAEHLPYEQDHLAAMGLTLGRPMVYRCKRLENWSDFDAVYMLDLSGYRISNTLKDPKSWAVVNCAIDAGISLLTLYTAGNAGLSLAHLLYEAGRLGERHFRLFALMENKLPESVQMALRAWDCTVVPTDETPRYLLEPQTLWKRIERLLEEENAHSDLRWHVTDGWDGVGVIMYRLMFIEVFRRLRPDFVVVPVGTGSLLTGAHLALKDVYGPAYEPRIVGAVPAGDNVTRDFISPRQLTGGRSAVAPKLVGRYSPLSPILAHVYKVHGGMFFEVSREMQDAAGRALLEGTRRDQLPIACEPSALAAPAALKGDGTYEGLWERLQVPTNHSSFKASASSVLVVNSGLGLLGDIDVEFLKDLF